MPDGAQELLPEQLLDLPEIGRLTHESRAVHPRKSRDEETVMQAANLWKAKVFAHHFHG